MRAKPQRKTMGGSTNRSTAIAVGKVWANTVRATEGLHVRILVTILMHGGQSQPTTGPNVPPNFMSGMFTLLIISLIFLTNSFISSSLNNFVNKF